MFYPAATKASLPTGPTEPQMTLFANDSIITGLIMIMMRHYTGRRSQHCRPGAITATSRTKTKEVIFDTEDHSALRSYNHWGRSGAGLKLQVSWTVNLSGPGLGCLHNEEGPAASLFPEDAVEEQTLSNPAEKLLLFCSREYPDLWLYRLVCQLQCIREQTTEAGH